MSCGLSDIRFLLLGCGQSGKSTFLKQMKILHGQSFSTVSECLKYRPVINENLIESFMIVLQTAAERMELGFEMTGIVQRVGEHTKNFDTKQTSKKTLFLIRQKAEEFFRYYNVYFRVRRVQSPENVPLPISIGALISYLWLQKEIKESYELARQHSAIIDNARLAR